MRLVSTTEDFAGSLGEPPRVQHTVGFDDLAFTVDPHRPYGVEPRAWVDTKRKVL
jgi:hypothetical protein